MKKIMPSRFLCRCVSALVAAAIFFSAGGGEAMASQSGPGVITGVYVMESGVVLFHHHGSRSALPGCGSPNPIRWAFDGATPAGQAKLALLLTAHSSQKPVVVHGTGTCTAWGDTETIQFILTAD